MKRSAIAGVVLLAACNLARAETVKLKLDGVA